MIKVEASQTERRERRVLHDLHGILLVDKPAGITSFDVIRQLKRKFSPKKIGHAGTLDPFADGLLIILLGKATKIQSHLLTADKSYRGQIRFGVASNTDDITGELSPTDDLFSWEALGGVDEVIARLTASFLGKQQQRPPAFSAIQRDGQRSYRLARQGIMLEHEPREIEIKQLHLSPAGADTLNYSLTCSKGTYVRALARDMGRFLGTAALVQTLTREGSTPFVIAQAKPLSELILLEDLTPRLLPPEALAFC